MAAYTREEFLEALRKRVGEDTSDEAISFVQNMTETYDAMAANNGEDWKKKYEENDAQWRQKYRDTFFQATPEPEEPQTEEPKKPHTFNDLFKEGGH